MAPGSFRAAAGRGVPAEREHLTTGRQSKSYCTGVERYIQQAIYMGDSIMHNFRFSVVIEKDEEGYTAFCPELQGCYAQGETYEEVLDNIRDAIHLHIDDRIESGEKIPQAQLINLTTVEVSV
jgi:predicted RNase H-like HicB family nuclease